jgi:3-phosphoshikimate 1-carboxyvinyltransferase
VRIEPAAAIAGHVAVPGDKSISHRAVLLGLAGEGETRIAGFGRSADTESTLAAARSLGATVYEHDDAVRVFGVGLRGLQAPRKPIDCGNAGTLMRLLPGLLAGQEGRRFELTGDESLSGRPMERVAEPLRRMGAAIETTEGHAPVRIEGAPLAPTTYELPVASAQVKSAVLLAGLFAQGGETTVLEPVPTRDHTERLLAAAGARVQSRPKSVSVWPAERLEPGDLEVPGDASAAAPLLVAATLLAGSELSIDGVNINPRRSWILDVLQGMGARITVF